MTIFSNFCLEFWMQPSPLETTQTIALVKKVSMKHSDHTLFHITAILGPLLLTMAAKACVVNK